MKDVQGIQRGKCNICECKEYRTPPSDAPSKFRCEYCNHTPVEHVRIEKLGKCNKCGDCEEYQSEDNNSYTDCGYCGCDASDHSGSEKLRKTAPPTTVAGAGVMMTSGSPNTLTMLPQQLGGPIQPRLNAQGQPVQTGLFGTCKNPGCPFPKRVEGGKVHDFCSRTCSQKYQKASSGPPPGKLMGGPPVSAAGGPSMSGGLPMFPTGPPGPGMVPPGPSGPPGPPSAGGGPQKPCSKCNMRPANPGRGWCEPCFRSKSS